MGLRTDDLLFTYDDDRLIALLTQTDGATADAVMRRVGTELASLIFGTDGFRSLAVRIGRASAPDDGAAIGQLIKVAESRALPAPSSTRPSIH